MENRGLYFGTCMLPGGVKAGLAEKRDRCTNASLNANVMEMGAMMITGCRPPSSETLRVERMNK